MLLLHLLLQDWLDTRKEGKKALMTCKEMQTFLAKLL